MEGNFQARGLTTLEGPELCNVNRMVYPFQIQPCKTRVRSMHLTNSFMYRKETIATAYEGAGWAFSTKTYHHTPPIRVHHQGFEIIHCTVCTSLLLLFCLNFWNLLLSLIGYLLRMLWPMNGDLLKDQMHHIKVIGMRHLIPIIDLSSVETQLTSLNTAYSASSSPL